MMVMPLVLTTFAMCVAAFAVGTAIGLLFGMTADIAFLLGALLAMVALVTNVIEMSRR